MQHVSASTLNNSLPDRIAYLSSFLNFTEKDGEALRAAKPLVAPLIPAVLDAVYEKLLSYDITAQAFVPRNTGYEGETVNNVGELTMEHPQIAMRRDFLKNYLVRLVSTSDISPTSSFWTYLNNVGTMHTGKPGFKHRRNRPDLKVDYIHMGALLGYVQDILIDAVMDMDIDLATKSNVLRALNKMLWIQNDLFARHYIPSEKAEERQGENGVDAVHHVEHHAEGGVACPFSRH
ncbi:Uncharacterized protein BP5553_03981 [Venustampulla echinocandica]|uniref:Globin-sensor domain-containing protein n=1 Tax=Venustampulla echinocandica TaxID=2656787 RepID=A0A370TVU2_9HELO|nr:Uncharacterized protein BP5553_03981 [Venustampulla echinocandica]RDL39641.1 Uncharacterized protein BP5553_03981 [Venustampulla echinocandica]